jgi:hypothetical protein
MKWLDTQPYKSNCINVSTIYIFVIKQQKHIKLIKVGKIERDS